MEWETVKTKPLKGTFWETHKVILANCGRICDLAWGKRLPFEEEHESSSS